MENRENFHAYLINGGKEILPELLRIYEKKTGESTKGNSNIIIFETSTLTIDDAREIKLLAGQKRLNTDTEKWIIIFAGFLATEAQQALLKTLEEPQEGTNFFLITNSSSGILPTLRSRLQEYKGITEEKLDYGFAKKFLSSKSGERLKIISEFLKERDELESGNIKIELLSILNSFESLIYKNGDQEHLKIAGPELIKARDFLNDRSPSVKMIFEHLALVLPVIS